MLRESATNRRQAHQDCGFNVFDNLVESSVLFSTVVGTREIDFVIGKLVAAIICDKALYVCQRMHRIKMTTVYQSDLGIHKPETPPCLVFCQPFSHEKLDNLFCDPDTCTAGTEKYRSLIFRGDTCALDGVYEAGQDDGPGSLDVVVEARVRILISFECRKWVLEILKLNDNATTRSAKAGADPTMTATDPGHLSVSAAISSSRNSISSACDTFSRRLPKYKGSSRRALFPVPRSSVRGRVASGLIPAHAVYSASLPTGMPMPLMPKSPRPNIRDPSVTTVISTL